MISMIETIKEIVNLAYKTFLNETSIESIADTEKEISSFKESNRNYVLLTDENKELVEGWLIKLHLKYCLLSYVTDLYSDSTYDYAIQYINQIIETAKAKNYKVIFEISQSLFIFFGIFHPITKKYFEVLEKESKLFENNSTVDCVNLVESCIKSLDELKTAKEILNDAFNNDVKIPDFTNEIKEEFEGAKSLFSNRKTEISFSKYASRIKTIIEMYPDKPIYHQEFDNRNKMSDGKVKKLTIIYSPLPDEVYLHLRAKEVEEKIKFSIINMNEFSDMTQTDFQTMLDYLSQNKQHLLVENLNRFVGNLSLESIANLLFKYCIDGFQVFISDKTGRSNLYDNLIQICNTLNCNFMVHYTYLAMPDYINLINLIEEHDKTNSDNKILGTPTAKEIIREDMKFMGYVGLNEILKDSQNWIKMGVRIASQHNVSELEEYLHNIPQTFLFIDSGWGKFNEFSKVDTNKRKINFDYDSIENVNKRNIEKIINFKGSTFARCGALVRYCLLADEDYSKWELLDESEKMARVINATKCVFKILNIDFVPSVIVSDNLGEKVGGLCMDSGKTIKYLRNSLNDLNDISDSICHESYHAFQHFTIKNIYQEWYFVELGVTRSRIEEWYRNFQNYNSSKRNSYFNQIVEADARAFANDCLENCDSVWIEIDFE